MNTVQAQTSLKGNGGKQGREVGHMGKPSVGCKPGRRCLECELHFCRQDRYKVTNEEFQSHGVFFKFIRSLDRKETD